MKVTLAEIKSDGSITLFMAIAAFIWPVLYFASLWVFSRIFVSKESYMADMKARDAALEEYKATAQNAQ